MIPPLNRDGLLSPGRWGGSFAEVEQMFVVGQSALRRQIWVDFQNAFNLLHGVTKISRVWIGGSFTTDKPNPGDIDVVFIIRNDVLEAAHKDPMKNKMLNIFAKRKVKELLNMRVDSFILPWVLSASQEASSNQVVANYYKGRGYWDDFWERTRTPTGADLPLESDVYQRRGYVEVIVDGNNK